MEENASFIERRFWGLDPLFDCYVTLFICDILRLEKYPTGDGAYAYKNHPIHRVDIFGMVVRLNEKDRYYHVDVDDGTGVISCSCWKQKMTIYDKDNLGPDTEYKNLFKALRTLTLQGEESKKIQLGDMLHVRGDIGEFRDRREISAPYYRVEKDLNAEANRIRSAVHQYKTVYDIPFILNDDRGGGQGDSSGLKIEANLVSELADALKNYIVETKIESYSLSSLLDVTELLAIAAQKCQDCTDKQNGDNPQATPPEKHHLQCAVQLLVQEAFCFLSDDEESFLVVPYCRSLERAVLDIIKQIKNHEGTHYLKVHSHLLRTGTFKHVSAYMVKKSLEKLEESSRIVSVTNAKFVAL